MADSTEDPKASPPTWEEAWHDSLYGTHGFYRRQSPATHFRTSVHASGHFAAAVVELVRRCGLHQVVDVGAGDGELLTQLHRLEPSLDLVGVEIRRRPAALDAAVGWQQALPERVDGLLLANEWLDNLPCPVVELDETGLERAVHVDPATGIERLGEPVDDEQAEWLATWWRLRMPGDRAEVGLPRDNAWADAVGRVGYGVAVAVDYGHTRDTRPAYGTLTAFRDGREVEPIPDGHRDLTAHVAWDSLVAVAPGGILLRQREALAGLGVTGRRPPLERAREDPAGYLAGLVAASSAAELVDPAGMGGFGWVVHARGVDLPAGWRAE